MLQLGLEHAIATGLEHAIARIEHVIARATNLLTKTPATSLGIVSSHPLPHDATRFVKSCFVLGLLTKFCKLSFHENNCSLNFFAQIELPNFKTVF